MSHVVQKKVYFYLKKIFFQHLSTSTNIFGVIQFIFSALNIIINLFLGTRAKNERTDRHFTHTLPTQHGPTHSVCANQAPLAMVRA